MSEQQTGIAIYSEETVIQALRNSLGNMRLAAMELMVSRAELVTFIVNHPPVAIARKEIKDGITDDMEDRLIEGAKTDNTLLMFYLKTQAADRGYGNKSNTIHTGPDGRPIEVKVTSRTLIAAMQRGMDSFVEEAEEIEEDYVEAEYTTESNLLEQLPVE